MMHVEGVNDDNINSVHSELHIKWMKKHTADVWNYHKIVSGMLLSHTRVDSLDNDMIVLSAYPTEDSIGTYNVDLLMACHDIVHDSNVSDKIVDVEKMHDTVVSRMHELKLSHFTPLHNMDNVGTSDVMINTNDEIGRLQREYIQKQIDLLYSASVKLKNA